MTTAHPHKNPAVADIDAREAADPRVALTNRQCEIEGGWGPTTQRKKQAEGCLNVFRNGTRVMNTAKSFYEHLRALASAPQQKVRQPKTMFKPRRRAPLTEAERAGLRAGNEGRHEAAQQRREARTAART
jgi:hypothetical protein